VNYINMYIKFLSYPQSMHLCFSARGQIVGDAFSLCVSLVLLTDHPIWKWPPASGRRRFQDPHVLLYAAVHQSRTEIEDAAILREFHSSFHQILEIIFKDFHFLTPAGKVGDSRRTLVSKFLLFSRDDPEIRRYVTQNSAGRNYPISPFSQVDV